MWGRKERQPVDKSKYDMIEVQTAAGRVERFNKNSHYYQVEGETIYIYDVATARPVALFPRFTGVRYYNGWFEAMYA